MGSWQLNIDRLVTAASYRASRRAQRPAQWPSGGRLPSEAVSSLPPRLGEPFPTLNHVEGLDSPLAAGAFEIPTTAPARLQLLKTRYRESHRHANRASAGTGNVEIRISLANLRGRVGLDRGRRKAVGRPLSGRSAANPMAPCAVTVPGKAPPRAKSAG
jgi:hypothetical protein